MPMRSSRVIMVDVYRTMRSGVVLRALREHRFDDQADVLKRRTEQEVVLEAVAAPPPVNELVLRRGRATAGVRVSPARLPLLGGRGGGGATVLDGGHDDAILCFVIHVDDD